MTRRALRSSHCHAAGRGHAARVFSQAETSISRRGSTNRALSFWRSAPTPCRPICDFKRRPIKRCHFVETIPKVERGSRWLSKGRSIVVIAIAGQILEEMDIRKMALDDRVSGRWINFTEKRRSFTILLGSYDSNRYIGFGKKWIFIRWCWIIVATIVEQILMGNIYIYIEGKAVLH